MVNIKTESAILRSEEVNKTGNGRGSHHGLSKTDPLSSEHFTRQTRDLDDDSWNALKLSSNHSSGRQIEDKAEKKSPREKLLGLIKDLKNEIKQDLATKIEDRAELRDLSHFLTQAKGIIERGGSLNDDAIGKIFKLFDEKKAALERKGDDITEQDELANTFKKSPRQFFRDLARKVGF